MHNLREGSNFYVKAEQNESKTKPGRKKTKSFFQTWELSIRQKERKP